MKFNVNHDVKVKLTPKGINILKRRHEELCRLIDKEPDFKEPKVDEDGYVTFQMWNLMHCFGHEICLGQELPFKAEIILSV